MVRQDLTKIRTFSINRKTYLIIRDQILESLGYFSELRERDNEGYH